jgi:hypothetical protein
MEKSGSSRNAGKQQSFSTSNKEEEEGKKNIKKEVKGKKKI